MQQEADVLAAVMADIFPHGRDDDGRSVVATHGVEGNQYGGWQKGTLSGASYDATLIWAVQDRPATG